MNKDEEAEKEAYFRKCLYCIFRDKQGTWCHKYIKNKVRCVKLVRESHE